MRHWLDRFWRIFRIFLSQVKHPPPLPPAQCWPDTKWPKCRKDWSTLIRGARVNLENGIFSSSANFIKKSSKFCKSVSRVLQPIVVSTSNEPPICLDGHSFDGITRRCDHDNGNFWQQSVGVRRATVQLRRVRTAQQAGIFTGTSCGTPTYEISDIFIRFG